MKLKHTLLSTLSIISLSLTACGGGGGNGSDGVVFQGTLTERGADSHSPSALVLRHSSGEQIGEVKICILDQCSVTDDLGQWGVNVGSFNGGEFVISLDGHGILAQVKTSVPAGAKDVTVDLGHSGNKVSVEKLIIDGEDHSEHEHMHE